MDYSEILKNARECSGPYCKACPVCNGMACRTQVPGPGGKGTAATMLRNYQKWQEVCINMDTICENAPIDTTFTMFGRTFAAPIFAAPVGAMKLHYGDKYDDLTYNDILVSSCAQAGIAAFTGDGTNPAVMEGALHAIAASGGAGIPTVKPWNMETVFAKLDAVRQADPVAVAMDIDAAGLPFLKGLTPPAGSKTVEELRQIIDYAKKPFIIKGIMTVRGAQKALEAGASAIVVSNPGGRAQDQCPSTAEVLPAIADAVGGKLTILVDGGLRNGTDIFKALALGADGVLIGRPFVTMVYGGGAQGPGVLVKKLQEELADTISKTALCGLGQSACKPVQSTLKYFRDEYLAHVVDHHCPICNKEKPHPTIDPEKCKGCGKCRKNCPMEAITGAAKQVHVIDPEKCINCGACVTNCPFGAITASK